jgi:Calcineurin-like phosphoesterase/Purple acid Phosphatase, N-terminal domain/TAT (twin-arginine translocation) pathway signal sequence
METPYGEIPQRLVKDMSAQEMHDYLRKRHSRRNFLKGAAGGGALAVAGPTLLTRSFSDPSAAGSPVGPQWIALGDNPATEMHISWSAGAYTTKANVPKPVVRWGLTSEYGHLTDAFADLVPTPTNAPAQNLDLTSYQHALLTGLRPDTTYHYSVSNDGTTFGPDTTFRTGKAGVEDFRFAATGDEDTFVTSSAMVMASIASYAPDFTIVAGDLSYASDDGVYKGVGTPIPYTPQSWDEYFALLGPAAAQSIPWMVGMGNHDVEPLTENGFAGILTRFPHLGATKAARGSGSKVVQSFVYGNVAIIGLDDSDVSALDTVNNGYTSGQQTIWFIEQLEKYRKPGSGVDFIVVFFHHCPYCSGGPGSDGGDRYVWQPLFDKYDVDLVVNGHNHLYERVYPLRNNVVTAEVPPGGTIDPVKMGTTYICTGGGGAGLAATATSGWFGTSGGGDEATTGTGTPPIEVWSTETSRGIGSGGTNSQPDTVTGWSAYRRAQYCHLVIDVTAPKVHGGQTSMLIRAIDPTQSGSTITSITDEVVMDNVTLVRKSVTGPGGNQNRQ